ncbi:MAG: hypothetical protein IH987_02765 [Planctomycetes bacterium]|nr:hypothetical protein [Planctomycetota bacterium]
MPPSQWVHLAAMPITVPTGTTSYTIDLLNLPNTDDTNYGAAIDFGFGATPGDPVTKFASADGADGTIAYAPSGECGGLILYDGALQQFQRPSECCGNGVVEPGETCDDGGESATCDADCTIAECGDGTLNTTAGEVCDDGNTDPDDGCDCLFGLGACCLGTACSIVTESDCLDSGGTFFGLDTSCDSPDADGDGLRDECDGCPADSSKIEPGLCGCGEDDTPDSDGDGVPDCVDTCLGADDAFLSHCEPPLFKLWVTEVYEVNPDGSYTPKCGASCPTQDLPGGLAEPGDLINIEVTVEGWDADIDLGQCNSFGEECSVSAQDCANAHCSGSQTSGECTQDSDCFLPDTCDPDRCEKTPKLGTFQWTIDSSTYSNGGPGPGFAPAELACTTDEDCACAYTEIPGNSNDCADFAALGPGSCTCSQAACNTSVCGPRAAGYIDSSPVSNFVFFNHEALTGVDVSSLDYSFGGVSLQGNAGGVPEDLFRCNAGARPACNVDADCTAGTCELVATTPFYLGTLLLEATGESCGLFALDLRQDVVQGAAVWTFVNADTAVKFPTPIVEPLTIEIGGQAGDCNGNGIPDECDAPVCGDGCIMGTEECDDGNTNSGDGCDANCMFDQGACCLGIACSITAGSDCLDSGGTFFGPNSTCGAPDADGDGLRNECDGCPDDTNKIEPGACGCGVDDSADSDHDGVPDCEDLCPGADDAVFGDCTGTIPTVSVWGLMILTLLLLAGSKVVFRDRSRSSLFS